MEYLFIFPLGGITYGLIELLWRGYTHWTMLLLGGACFTAGYRISFTDISFFKKLMLLTTLVVTFEYITGVIVNIFLKWDVWDYSSQRFNVLGQICPQFSIGWMCLSAVSLPVLRSLRKSLH